MILKSVPAALCCALSLLHLDCVQLLCPLPAGGPDSCKQQAVPVPHDVCLFVSKATTQLLNTLSLCSCGWQIKSHMQSILDTMVT